MNQEYISKMVHLDPSGTIHRLWLRNKYRRRRKMELKESIFRRVAHKKNQIIVKINGSTDMNIIHVCKVYRM
jgi:hypothetical protein